MNPNKDRKYRCGIVLSAAALGAVGGGVSLWLPLWTAAGGGGPLIFNPFPSSRAMAWVAGSFGAIAGCVAGVVIGFLMQVIVFYGRRQ